MDIILIVIGIILLIVGLVGSILPILPGPPIAYIALLLLQFTHKHPFSTTFLVLSAAVIIVVSILDYIIPTLGTKKFGGSTYGSWGCMIGTIAGLFLFPPLGIIIMPFIGAFIGEMIFDNQPQKALKAAFGSFIGFISGTLMKIAVCLLMIFAFVWGMLS